MTDPVVHAEAQEGHPPDRDLHVIVTAPRFPDKPREFTFEPNSQIGADATHAANTFGYTTGTWSFSLNGVELTASQTLGEAGVKSGDKLDLVDTGGGV